MKTNATAQSLLIILGAIGIVFLTKMSYNLYLEYQLVEGVKKLASEAKQRRLNANYPFKHKYVNKTKRRINPKTVYINGVPEKKKRNYLNWEK